MNARAQRGSSTGTAVCTLLAVCMTLAAGLLLTGHTVYAFLSIVVGVAIGGYLARKEIANSG